MKLTFFSWLNHFQECLYHRISEEFLPLKGKLIIKHLKQKLKHKVK